MRGALNYRLRLYPFFPSLGNKPDPDNAGVGNDIINHLRLIHTFVLLLYIRQKSSFTMKKSNLFLLALCILTSFSVFGQYSISGVVRDTLKNPIYGALVKIEGTYQGTFTGPDGNYTINNLPRGNYDVSAEVIGFKKVFNSVTIIDSNVVSDFILFVSPQSLDEVSIEATRVKSNAPVAHTNVKSEEYEKVNLGQDIASLIKLTPSIVTTSDAGAGVGYTGFRIRGSDASRINVTVNGIPINDAESHGTFWVNMPDFASSTDNIQIQRGVGTSTNGAAAFGASVNLQTDLVSDSAYAELSSSYGSFNTNKNTIKLGTGLINKYWSVDGRISSITSDGYIDRSSADLSSYFLQGGYYGKKSIIKAVTFAGKEKTYQAWWGTPEAKLNDNRKGVLSSIENNYWGSKDSANLVNSDRRYNYYTYDNEVDNYNQDHYQLHFTHQFNDKLSANASLHYTYGRGYYEQYRNGDDFTDYSIDTLFTLNDTITSGDFIRRRWLENHFYGGVYSIKYRTKKANFILGGGYNDYVGDHFGEIIWAQYASNSSIRDKYYDNEGKKTDFNSYLKSEFSISKKVNGFVDLQIRNISYTNVGIDADLRELDVDTAFTFFNPKLGVNYELNDKISGYASFSVANREPVRNDFIDNPRNEQPRHETLYDYELGIKGGFKKFLGQANFYFMDYTNQLVVTGALNDVGSSVRDNVENSYRAGVELVASYRITKKLEWNLNTTISQNKIQEFTEVITDWDTYASVKNVYEKTDIAFSPSIIAASLISFKPLKGFEVGLQSKFVGKQYLDNTSSSDRDLPSYFVSDLRASYVTSFLSLRQIQFNLLVNNILNEVYSNNGYTWGGLTPDGRVSENFLYPQAGTNILTGITIKF